jgi:hypothetical protein
MVTISVEEAQQKLKSLADRALNGESVFIRVHGTDQLLSLQSVPPELPPNYLAQCYGPEEVAEENYLATFAPKGTAT